MKIKLYILLLILLPLNLFAGENIEVLDGKIIIDFSIADTSEISSLPADDGGHFISYSFCSPSENIPTISVNGTDNGYILNYSGKIRGIDIYKLKIYQNCGGSSFAYSQKIEITLGSVASIIENTDESVFDVGKLAIINKQHIPAIMNYNLQKSLKKQSKNPDYLQFSQGQKLLKLTTSDDGIAKFPLKSLIQLFPDMSGKSISNLTLKYKGQNESFYSDSPDGTINENSNIFFVARHAYGDTSFFDYYNAKAVYFLSFDSENSGSMFSATNSSLTAKDTLKSVTMLIHLEKDSLYAYGFGTDVQNSELVTGEGWYHLPLTPTKDSVINIAADFYPSNNDKVNVKAFFFETKINSNLPYNHYVKSYINNIFTDTLNSPYKEDSYNETMQTDVASGLFVHGSNTFTLKSIGHREYGDTALTSDGLGFDYLEISGNALPIATNNICSFSTDSLPNASLLKIYPFASPEIIVFDTLNKTMLSSTIARGYALTSNSSTRSRFSSFLINGKVVAYDSSTGFHLLTVSTTDLSYKSTNYAENQFDAFISDITRQRSSNDIAFSINLVQLTDYERNTLSSIGIDISMTYDSVATSGILSAGSSSAISATSQKISANTAFINNDLADKYSCSIILSSGRHSIVAAENSSFISPEADSVSFVELKRTTSPDVIVIAPEKFREVAQSYILYRSATHKNLSFAFTDVKDIYNEFGNGFISPHAIKAYLKYLYDLPQSNLSVAVLIGDATNDARKLLPTTKSVCYIPSFGFPVSDSWYSWLDDPTPIKASDGTITGYKQDLFSDILLSRIPIASEDDMTNYLNKIKVYDNSANAPWKNSFLFLTGGYNSSEIQTFRNYYTEPLNRIFERSDLCHVSEFINKSQDGSTYSADGIYVLNSLNKGKIFTSFIGHGSPLLLDLDGWTPENLANTGKYGIFYTESCNTGNFALDEAQTRFERYLFAKDRGFIMTIGASTTEDVWAGNIVAQFFATEIASRNARNIVSAYLTAKMNAYIAYDLATEYNKLFGKLQYYGTVLGDPLLELPSDTVPEFYLLPEEFTVQSPAGSNTITEDNENAVVKCTIRNLGLKGYGSINVMLIDKYGSSSDTARSTIPYCCPEGEFEYKLPVIGHTGLHLLSIIVDPDSLIYEHRKDNNRLTLQFEVLQNALLPVEPLQYFNITATNPVFRMISPLEMSDTISYYMNIIQEETGDIVKSSTPEDLIVENNVIDWKPDITLSKNKNYILRAGYYYNSGITPANISEIRFHTGSEIQQNMVDYRRTHNNLASANTTNLEYNSSSNVLQYECDTVPYQLIGISGGTFDSVTVNRGAFLKLNNEYVMTEPRETIGFHIIHYDRNFTNMRHKYFPTWGTHVDWESEKDSVSINMVKYLQDSVKTDDNIFIATMGDAFRLFSLHNQWHTSGSWDTLKTILEGYGSKLAYTIDTLYKPSNAWSISYVAACHVNPNAPYFSEGISLIGDSAITEGNMLQYYSSAKISYEIQSADSLLSISVGGQNMFDHNAVKTTIFGRSSSDAKWIAIVKSDTLPLTLPAINTKYSDFNVEHDFYKTGNEPLSFEISEIRASYIPAAEPGLYILEQPASGLLNGEADTMKFAIRNLSVRRDIDSATCNIKITDGTNIIDTAVITSTNIASDVSVPVYYLPETDNYSQNILILGTLSALSGNELYDFNDHVSSSQTFISDTVKPNIYLEADNILLRSGDNIRIQPTLRAYFKDNSPKVINSSQQLRVRINTRYAADNNTQNYLFTAYPKGNDIKAELTFMPDSLDFDENILRVYAEDANGNCDTAYYSLFVSNKGAITELTIYPNPLEISSTVSFDYFAPTQEGYTLIEIFSYDGKLINSYKMPLHIGHNEIPVFITDKRSAPLPNGVYFYRVSTTGSPVFIEPIEDKFVVSR